MNSRRKRKLLCSIFNLIENEELSEKEWQEVFDKWRAQLRQNDRDVNKLQIETFKISKTQVDRAKAVGILLKEFVEETLAAIVVKWMRGY